MSAVVAQINVSALTSKPKPIEETVYVGKDVLELLAGAMYVDPLNVFREYIQNAADAIDEARNQELVFDETPGVQISFDHSARIIKIRDNGTSIPARDFVRRLVTIGASQKRGKKLRGFRGVGRLSGLGYCQELVFRGRADGDKKVSEIIWNGRELRDKLRDERYEGDLSALVQDVVKINQVSADGFPSRFFEVELRKIARLKNDMLLNEVAVRQYISEVAPVPFDKEFGLGKEIQKQLSLRGISDPIHIELNDGNGPITHRIKNQIEFSETVSDQIRRVDFIELKGDDGELAAFGWIADHAYGGSIPKRLGLGGIRLRAGNIQVGDESMLAALFPESRFAGWAIGDIHVLSPKILPNGRRDDFEPTVAYAHLQGELALHAREITQIIRNRSAQRNQLKTAQQHLGAVDVWLKSAYAKELPQPMLQALQELAIERLGKASKEAAKLSTDDGSAQAVLARVAGLDSLVKGLSKRGGSKKRGPSLATELDLPVRTALKTILSGAKTPDAGIDLCLEVLAAIAAVAN